MQPVADKMKIALDLTDVGIQLRTQQFRRQHPTATEGEILAMTQHWLERRGMSESAQNQSLRGHRGVI